MFEREGHYHRAHALQIKQPFEVILGKLWRHF